MKSFYFFTTFATVMTILEMFIIAVGLAMDAFAVSISKGLTVDKIRTRHCLIVGAWFGGFQALMPIIGYYLGTSFAQYVENFDHWIAFGLLALIGTNMIRESLDDECEKSVNNFSAKHMLPLAVATSIDALAIGISFAFLKQSIALPSTIIGITTAIISIAGLYIGKAFGCKYRSKAEFLGGAVLIIIGIKILVEHTLF